MFSAEHIACCEMAVMARSRAVWRSAVVWKASPDMYSVISFTYWLVSWSFFAVDVRARERRKLHASLRFTQMLSSFCSSEKVVVSIVFMLDSSFRDCGSPWFGEKGSVSMGPADSMESDEPQLLM